MGETKVKVGILNLTDASLPPQPVCRPDGTGRRGRQAHLKAIEVECLVGTGATLTTLPGRVLAQAKITPTGKVKLHLADGREIIRDYGQAKLMLNGETIILDRVVFGQANDPALLGLTALETAGLVVDPIARKLIKKDYYQQY